jgi:hypothetical protein
MSDAKKTMANTSLLKPKTYPPTNKNNSETIKANQL